MTANELRIGNYFYPILRDVPSDIPHMPVKIPHKITYFGQFDKVIACLTTENIVSIEAPKEFKFNDMSPIPLTEEWLIELGFNKFPQSKFYDRDDFFVLYPRNGNEWHLQALECVIKHVHQLQNLYFALTGEELTIKNK